MTLPDNKTSKWQLPFAYLGLVSLGLAQPIFNITELFRREFQVDIYDVLSIVLVFQFISTGILIALRWALKKPRLQTGLDIIILAGCAMTIIRQIQMHYLKTEGMTADTKFLIVGALVLAAVLIVIFFRKYILIAATYFGYASPVFGIFFIYSMATHPLPLNKGGEAAQPTSNKPAVMVIVMDEFALPMIEAKRGEIDNKTYPHFAALAARSTWFPNAITNYPTSSFSFPSFLTSRYDFGYDISLVNNLENLPATNVLQAFKNNGYNVEIYTDYFGCAGRVYLCKSYLSGAESGFLLKTFLKFVEEFGPDFIVDRVFPGIHGSRILHQHRKWFEAAESAQPGDFHFIHLMSSHAPYVFNADGSFRHSRNLRMASGVNFDDAVANYREQLIFLDSVVGDFLNLLDARPKNNPMIVLIMSDHGNCWTKACPGRVQPKRIKTVMPSLSSVPAFLILPDQTPHIDKDDFQLVDMSPTLLSAVGLDTSLLGSDFDGVSRLSPPPEGRPRSFFLSIDAKPLHIPMPNHAIEVE